MRVVFLLLLALGSRRGRRRAEHRRHPRRRHGLLRPRLLRRRDRARRTSTRSPPAALRFTQFYNTARCCPTRACLLTGLYPHQAGVGHMMDDNGHARLPRRPERRRAVTIAEVLQAGRLPHLRRRQVARHPAHRRRTGRSTTGRCSAGSTASTARSTAAAASTTRRTLVRDNTHDLAVRRPGVQAGDVLLHRRDHRPRRPVRRRPRQATTPTSRSSCTSRTPPPTGRCTPCRRTSPSTRASTTAGYEPIRKARFEKAAKLGLIDPKQALAPPAERLGRASQDKAWEAACMEVYAAMVDRMDQGIGQIVAELKRTGQLDNTLILFLQDNGGCAEMMGRDGDEEPPRRPAAGQADAAADAADDARRRAASPTQTRDGYPVRQGPSVMPGPADTYVAYGRGLGERVATRRSASTSTGSTRAASARRSSPTGRRASRRSGELRHAARPPDRRDGDVRRPGRGDVPDERRQRSRRWKA